MPEFKRLTRSEIGRHLAACPDDSCEIVLALRTVVLKAAPQVCETIKFKSLCYFKPGLRYGAIGGNVCLIDCRKGHVELAFIHGAFLPDPDGLLRGFGKAKRHIPIPSTSAARRASIRRLIQAAASYAPVHAKRKK